MSHQVIEYLRVEGGTFFSSLHLDFHPGHNDLIGEFGTGKSGVLHLITYALGARFELPDPDEHEEYVRGTLGAGRIEVGIRTRHGVPYKLTRAYGEPPIVYGADGLPADVPLDGNLFKLHAYGAGSLVEIARNPGKQLALIDAFAEAEIRRLGEEIEHVERDLRQSAVERRRLEIEIEEDEGRTGELASVGEALKGMGLADGGDNPEEAAKAHERKIARGRERTAMTALGKEIGAARAALDAFAGGTLRRLAATVEGDLEHGPSADLFRRAHEVVQGAAAAVEKGAGKLREELETAEKGAALHGRELAAVHAKEEDAYRALVVAEDADRVRAAERERLHRRYEELSTAAKRLSDRRRELGERLGDRDRLREKRALLYRERSAVRDAVARDLSAQLHGLVSVDVEQAADGEVYLELLTLLLCGSGVREDVIAEIAADIRPTKLIDLVLSDDGGPIEKADPSKTRKPERAQKILAHLRASERLYQLDTVPMGDLARLGLKIGEDFEPSNRLSLGQRCTCVFPVLLLLEGTLLMMRQPIEKLVEGGREAFVLRAERYGHLKPGTKKGDGE
jgi:hypothetical protein